MLPSKGQSYRGCCKGDVGALPAALNRASASSTLPALRHRRRAAVLAAACAGDSEACATELGGGDAVPDALPEGKASSRPAAKSCCSLLWPESGAAPTPAAAAPAATLLPLPLAPALGSRLMRS